MGECSDESSKQYALIPQSSHSLENASIVDVREEMVAVYEHYCTAYPNPDLALENEERDRLLQAISAADHAVQVNPKKKQRRGFFGSIFGSSKEQPEDRRIQVQADDERLNYTPTEIPPDDAWLLGTEFSLDTSNIPDEAHSVARQHLLARQPNIVRGSTAVLVQFGVLAWDGEMVTLPYQGLATASVAHTRAALVHSTLLAVSWGAADLDIVLYEQKNAIWQPVARLGPTRAVQEHLRNTEWDFDNDNSTLLAVTDLLALDAGTLVVARLGGFLEILLLDQPQQEPIAVTTSEYHVDVLGVELVGENILAAHGRTVDHRQVITFWMVGAEGGVTLLQEIDLDQMGPDVSVFCTPTILQHWRKPRSVSLRDKDTDTSQSESPITTISVSAPIVSLQCREGRYLAILDWNGGLSVLDCDFANTEFHILRSRSVTPHVGVQAVQWIDDALVTVNRRGRLMWRNIVIASIPPNSVAVLCDQQMVVQHGSQLRVCSIQELTAGAIVQSFVMNEQYVEALSAAQRLGDTERQTIHEDVERCKKILWERDGDIEILAQIYDDPYVIQQALGELESPRIDFAAVCRLALQRMKTTKLGSSLKVASSIEEFREIGANIEDRLLKYGSYILLCSRLSVQPKLSDFYDQFLNISVTELSHQFARRGDIISASILWIRHISELDALALLNEIPLSIPPAEYGHMLPTLQSGMFLKGLDEVSELSSFPSYFSERFDRDVVTDDKDESMIMERTPQPTLDPEVIVTWYTKRAATIYEFVPTLAHISQFGELAMLALGSDFTSQADGFAFGCYAKSLLELVSADSLGKDIMPTLVSLTWHNMDSFSVSSLVAIALDPEHSAEAMQDRFHNVLVPMLQNTVKGDSISLLEQLDHAVVTLGRSILKRSQRSDTVESNLLLEQTKQLSRIVWGCRSSLPKSQRLVSQRTILCRFVLDAVDDILSMLSATDGIKLSDQVQMVEILWKMYETLPVDMGGHEFVDTAGELDHLYKVLVALDLCSRWPSAMKHFSELSQRKRKVDQYCEKSLISAICFAACNQLTAPSSLDEHILAEFVESFLGDLQTIESNFVDTTLDVRNMVTLQFVQPVLQMEQVDVLALLLERDFLKPEDVVNVVLETFKEAVYGNGKISLATKLQEKLAPFFPELIQEFSSSASFLEATAHIRDILVPDGSLPFSPRELRETPSLDVVEAVLSKNPGCVVQQCTQWRDPHWSRLSNEKIRLHLRRGSHFGSADLPPLPAMAVYHLAQLLSLEGVSSVIAVKSKVIHHAVRAGFFGAAAAVCRTLLVDTYNHSTDPGPALSGVKDIISTDRYEDYETKRELCEAVFLHPSITLSKEATSAFNAIVDSWVSLEYNGVDRERIPGENTVRGLLSYATSEDENRIQDMLVNLRSELKLEDTTFENNLLEALSASSALWFTNSRVGKPRPDSTASFSISLLLHIAEEHQALQAFSRLQATLPKSAGDCCPDVGTRPKDAAPDHNIVAGLMSRGYSQNGALRSTIVTENEGFDQALQWAVAHSADTGFDDPMVFLCDQVTDLPVTSGDLNRFCAALEKLSLKFRREPVHNGEPKMAIKSLERIKPEDSSWDGGEWSDFEDEEDISDNHGDAGEAISDKHLIATQAPENEVVPSIVHQDSNTVDARSEVPATTERNCSEGVDLRKPFAAPVIESSLNASLPRSMLLQVGQAAFQNAKKVRSPTNEERQRLIEQGRAFLKQVHHASNDSLGPPSSPTNKLEKEVPTAAAASHNGGDDWDFEDDLSL